MGRTLLQQLRCERGLSRQEMLVLLRRRAKTMGIKGFTISMRTLDRYLAGEVRDEPHPVRRRVLEEEFGHPVSVLLAEVATLGCSEPSAPGAALALAAPAALPGVPTAIPRRVDPSTVEGLRRLMEEYVRLDNLLGPSHVLSLMSVHSHYIGELLTIASGSVRQDLLRLAAWYAEFTGWLWQDAGDVHAGVLWTDRALVWADVSEDVQMVSYVRMRRSNQASTAGDAPAALSFADAALGVPEDIGPRARALVGRQQARACAMVGDVAGCERAIDMARGAVGEPAEHEGGPYLPLTGYCTPAYIEAEAADCWLLLGQADKAAEVFEAGLAAWSEEYPRDRGLNLARLAVAYASANQLERASATGAEAAALVQSTWSARAVHELKRLPPMLRCCRDGRATADLIEMMVVPS